MEKIRNCFKSSRMIFLLIAFKLVVYYTLIHVNIARSFMSFISIAVIAGIFYGVAYSGWKKKGKVFCIFYFLISAIMFMDAMYYNYYNQIPSIKQLWQASNVASVPQSFIATLIPASFLLVIDLPFAYYYFKQEVKKVNYISRLRQPVRTGVAIVLTAIILLCTVNPTNSIMINKVNSVEFFTSHFKDIYATMTEKASAQEISTKKVISDVDTYTTKQTETKLNGIGKGKNLIVIQMESMQDFLIGKEYNGQVLTPNLNALVSNDSLYFDNFYSNIGKGNTADAEFSTLNSLYPVIDRESYTLYQDNTFHGLPWLLREEGYKTMAVHGFKGEFWNRANAYQGQGFEKFYAQEQLVSDDLIGLGISDRSMFRQTANILEEQTTPFFSFIVTLTNHHPYEIQDEYVSLQLKEEDKGTKFGSYLKTVRYMDETIGEFIQDLKQKGLYENTIIALYGDHHGLNKNMDDNGEKMSEFLGRTYDYDEMFQVPLIIHIPGLSEKSETIHTVGGQIDFLPTICNLMGVPVSHPFVLGQDLVNAKKGFVAFTAYLFEGSFATDGVMFEVSREGVFDGSRAFGIGETKELQAFDYKEEYERAVNLKKTSKAILDGDLISKPFQ